MDALLPASLLAAPLLGGAPLGAEPASAGPSAPTETPAPALVSPWALQVEVTDPEGLPVPGASVELESRLFVGGRRVLYADEEGRVRFESLPAGDVWVTVTHHGYDTGERRVLLPTTVERRLMRVSMVLRFAEPLIVDPWWSAVIRMGRGPDPVVLDSDGALGFVPGARDPNTQTLLAVPGWVVIDHGPQDLGALGWDEPAAPNVGVFLAWAEVPAGPTAGPTGYRRGPLQVLGPR